MNFLKRFGKALYILFLLGVGIYVISSDALVTLLRGLANSEQGPLVKIASFLKDADTWNIIFIILFAAVSVGLLMLFNLLVDWLARRVAEKLPRLSFLKSDTAGYIFTLPISLSLVLLTFVGAANIIVPVHERDKRIQSVNDILAPSPVFVLGTSKMLTSGKGENLYYRYRIDAALELYRAGKASFFILSGDGGLGRTDGYNETRDMMEDLVAGGVPESQIKIDTAGFRTLDSILRLRAVFRLNDIIIVSQSFHTPRAIFLSSFYGLNARAYQARGSATFSMIKREAISSRPKLIMDLIFFNMQPKITTPEGKAFEYRESFSAKSDLHVLLVLAVILLAVIMVMGYGVYQSKKGAERVRVVRRYSLIGGGLTVFVVVMITQLYKNLDIKFIDEVVESVAKTVGVKTDKMEQKKQEAEVEVRQTAKMDSVLLQRRLGDSLAAVAAAARIDSSLALLPPVKKPLFNSQSSTPTTESRATLDSVRTEKKSLFNSKKGRSTPTVVTASTVGTTGQAVAGNAIWFDAAVHGPQKFKENDVVRIRSASPIQLTSGTIPEHTVFEAKVAVYDNRFHFIVNKIESIELSGKNYGDDNSEGIPIKRENRLGSSYLLSDGVGLRFMIVSKI